MALRRILVADDESLFRSSVAESLRARFRDTEVIEAEDGRAALAVVEKSRVDVLVTDIQMPNMGGLELVAAIAGRQLPIQIIVTSAYTTDHARATLDQLGAMACLDKPIDLGALHDAVARMLRVPRAHVNGVTLPGFVQLLEIEHQSCALRVESPNGSGTLIFEGGVLADAWTPTLEGDAAALQILSYQDCRLDLVGTLRPSKRRVTKPMSYLLLEAARQSDESQAQSAGGVAVWEMLSILPPQAVVEDEQQSVDQKPISEEMMANITQSLRMAMEIEGAVGVALVDWQSGMSLGHAGGGNSLDLDVAAAGNTEVVRSKMRVMESLRLDDTIEDILITLGKQYHIIRPIKKGSSSLFLYVVIDRKRGNLGLARHQLSKIEIELVV